MGFFDKLFGRGKPKPAATPLAPFKAAPLPSRKDQPVDVPDAPKLMKVWDAYGRVGEIPREAWRTEILPLNFRNHWDHPDELAGLIANALNDGFVSDCLAPARQLHRIDPHPQRGAAYLGAILLQLKEFSEAEKVIRAHLAKHGEDGILLTNLAKAQSGLGDDALAERTLWHALEVDPNQDNGLLWYVALHRERAGEAGALECLRRLAALPGSWRAQLWLARESLKSRALEPALAWQREALARAPRPLPADLLQQISGDLGNAGHLPEILQLVAPHFDAKYHGLMVGNNLIKAHLDLGQLDAARDLLDRHYAQNRGDWKELLAYWDTELAKARLALSQPPPPDQLQMTMLTVEGPVWLKPGSPAAELFPAKTGERVSICFLGSTAEIATNSKRAERQLSNAPGQLSRALPLFLAEQVDFGSRTRVRTLMPWVLAEAPGFVYSGVPWNDDAAAQYARQGDSPNDYIVVTHLNPVHEPWTVEFRLIRTLDARCLGTLTATFTLNDPAPGITDLARRLLPLLREQAEVELLPQPPNYQLPAASRFASYLLRLEQLLAVRCANMDGVPAGFLHGEREVVEGNLQLCLDCPQNVGTRILLAQTLASFKRTRPEILPEFKERMALLQKEKPLPEPAHGVVQRLLNDVFAP